MQYNKPTDLKYTDLAIWIDSNAYGDTCDEETLYSYLYCLCYMLARKRGYFYNSQQYDEFSVFMADKLFQRYRCDKENEKDKIKSILNYIKGIIYYTKVDYTRQFWQENIKVNSLNEDGEAIYSLTNSQMRLCDDIFHIEFYDYLRSAKDTLRAVVRSTVQDADKITIERVYISSLLSFLNKIVLSERDIKRIDGISRSVGIKKSLINRLRDRNQDSPIILYKLKKEDYEETVDKVLSRFKEVFTTDVIDMVNQNKREHFEFMKYITKDFMQNVVYDNLDEDENYNTPDDYSDMH